MGDKQLHSQEALIENRAVFLSDFITLTYATHTQVFVASLPKGAMLLGYCIEIVTPFNDTTSNHIDIGTTGTTDHYVADFDGDGAAGIYRGNINHRMDADTNVYCDYTPVGTGHTAGEARIGLIWSPWAAGVGV